MASAVARILVSDMLRSRALCLCVLQSFKALNVAFKVLRECNEYKATRYQCDSCEGALITPAEGLGGYLKFHHFK